MKVHDQFRLTLFLRSTFLSDVARFTWMLWHVVGELCWERSVRTSRSAPGGTTGGLGSSSRQVTVVPVCSWVVMNGSVLQLEICFFLFDWEIQHSTYSFRASTGIFSLLLFWICPLPLSLEGDRLRRLAIVLKLYKFLGTEFKKEE